MSYFGEAADLFTESGTFQWGADGIYRGKARIQELLTRHGGGSMKDGPGLPFGRSSRVARKKQPE